MPAAMALCRGRVAGGGRGVRRAQVAAQAGEQRVGEQVVLGRDPGHVRAAAHEPVAGAKGEQRGGRAPGDGRVPDRAEAMVICRGGQADPGDRAGAHDGRALAGLDVEGGCDRAVGSLQRAQLVEQHGRVSAVAGIGERNGRHRRVVRPRPVGQPRRRRIARGDQVGAHEPQRMAGAGGRERRRSRDGGAHANGAGGRAGRAVHRADLPGEPGGQRRGAGGRGGRRGGGERGGDGDEEEDEDGWEAQACGHEGLTRPTRGTHRIPASWYCRPAVRWRRRCRRRPPAPPTARARPPPRPAQPRRPTCRA